MYGQQITVPEQMKKNPSIFNNTGERFLLQNRIPLTLVMEPLTHFNNLNTSSSPYNNSYTEFKILLGQDSITAVDILSQDSFNTFGQNISVGLNAGDIQTSTNNGVYNSLGTTLKVDRIYDVYIESITTHNTLPNTSKNTMAFMLHINDWNIDNNTNMTNMTNSIIIPNETTAAGATNTHKAKKLNYLTHLTPDTITSISGKISFLNDTTIFDTNELRETRLSIELVFIPRNKN